MRKRMIFMMYEYLEYRVVIAVVVVSQILGRFNNNSN